MRNNLNIKAAVSGAVFAIVLASLTAPAVAGDSSEIPHRVVKFADLDLTRGAGVAALYARIQWAARQVCEPMIARDLPSEMRARACAAQALDRAVTDVNAPQLTSYHLAKAGRKPAITVAHRN